MDEVFRKSATFDAPYNYGPADGDVLPEHGGDVHNIGGEGRDRESSGVEMRGDGTSTSR